MQKILPALTAQDNTAVQALAPELPALADPISGGNYVRDPVTGELSRNPAHFITTTHQE